MQFDTTDLPLFGLEYENSLYFKVKGDPSHFSCLHKDIKMTRLCQTMGSSGLVA